MKCLGYFNTRCYFLTSIIMKKILFLVLFTLPSFATIYHIGPGMTYSSLNDFHASVGWHNLVAGDEVLIHYQPSPYREFMHISSKGTASQHIKIKGVLGPNGERPIIDGENAIQPSSGFRYQDFNNFLVQTDGVLDLPNGNSEPDPTNPNIYTYYGGGLYHLGLVMIGRPSGSDWLDSPSYIDIENLEIRNARQNYQFKPHFSGQVSPSNPYSSVYNQPWKYFPSFTSGIWIQRCEGVEIRNCYIHDCGNGVFINSQAYDNGAGGISNLISRNVLIEKNDIQNNGCSGGFSCHNIYSEASQTIYQYNRIGKKYAGSAESNCIKDRGAGTVIRYNWFDATDQAHILDLVEAEASSAVMINEPAYDEAFVYGNVFLNPPTGPTTPFHYSGDHQDYNLYRKGTLHFWNNTFVNTSDQIGNPNAKYRMSLFLLPSSDNIGTTNLEEVIDLKNNIFVNRPETSGAASTEFYMTTTDGTATLNFTNNWISPGYLGGFSGKWGGTAYTPFVGTINHSQTINNPTNDPGFVDISQQELTPNSTAQVIDAGLPVVSVTQEYRKELNSVLRSNQGFIDIGAFEFQSNTGCSAAPSAGPDIAICLPKNSLQLFAAPSGTQWVADLNNPGFATINSLSGQISALSMAGTYKFYLQNTTDPSCQDEMQVIVANSATASILCDNGTTSYTLTAQSGLLEVKWYNEAQQEVGVGTSFVVSTSIAGLEDKSESFYYIGKLASGCEVSLCCPTNFVVQSCCASPNCLAVTVLKK
jgi:Right handed beta helix region